MDALRSTYLPGIESYKNLCEKTRIQAKHDTDKRACNETKCERQNTSSICWGYFGCKKDTYNDTTVFHKAASLFYVCPINVVGYSMHYNSFLEMDE